VENLGRTRRCLFRLVAARSLSPLLFWLVISVSIAFYLGKYASGILKLVTLGGLGGWWLIDIVLIAVRVTDDASGKPLR